MKALSSHVVASYSPTTPPGVLERIATWVYGPHSNSDITFAPHQSLCHLKVAKRIVTRAIDSDLIWIYGDGDRVYHSVLTDAHSTVLVGAQYSRTSNKFMGKDGFDILGYGTLELMLCITVRKMRIDYTDLP